ncbi:SusC/RagA family TonB-linked outer membrane protein [Paludibacter sp. 221]|nr:SusC/RagA family TonB-linked outer membrane protein [Paludibacter sp. 221]
MRSLVKAGVMLLFLWCCQFTISAQEKNITLNLKDVTVKDALEQLKSQTSYSLWFNVNDIDLKKKITTEIKDKSVSEALDVILEGQNLSYEIKDKYIQIFKLKDNPPKEQKTISGVITDESGETLPGVTVFFKEFPSVGTITDFDGNFHLAVPDGAKSVVISYIGMETQETGIKDAPMKITLKSDSQILEEVVVTGMVAVDKRLFTGASDNIKGDKARLDGIPDVSRALEGRSAGVSVQNVSGTFGTAPKIRVRGATSIYGSSKPLWVVDGVIMEDAVEIDSDDLSSGDAITLISSAIAGLSADDIESFQILKDGSATSIYGARAMAGVVVITTKRGQVGVNRITYTGEFTTRLKPSYRDFNIMNSQDQMSVYNEMDQKNWFNFADSYRVSNSGVYGKMYQLTNTYDPVKQAWELENTPEARNRYLQQAEMRNTDWFDELFNTNLTQNHAISISSGSDKARYYASLSVFQDPGWTKASSVSRYTANTNASFNLAKNLTLTLLSNSSYRKQKAPGTLSQEVNVVSGEVRRDFDINPYSYALNTSRTLALRNESGDLEYYTRNYAPFNIESELERNYIELDVVDLKFQGELNWKIIKGLEASVLGAVKYQTTSQEHTMHDKSNQAEAYRAAGDAIIRDKNPLLYKNLEEANALPVVVLPEGGILDKNEYKMMGYDLRASMNYNTSINDTHLIRLFGGTEANSVDRGQYYSRGWGYQYDKGGVPFYDYLIFKQGIEQNNQYYYNYVTYSRNLAFFGMATYSYEGKYTINGTLRYEGSNRLGKSRAARWLPTWNVALAWNMHEEKFFSALTPALSHFTLKTSYSLTADRGPAFVTNSHVVYRNYSPFRPFAGVKESGLEIESLENSELTYEKKHEFNIGADMGFLKNRINLSTDFYTRNNFDLIGPIFTQGAGGEVGKYANVASMKSHGIEFTLSTKNIVTKDFKWNTDFIFGFSENEITKLDSRTRVMALISGAGYAEEGRPVRSLFSIPFVGLSEDGLPMFINQNDEITITDIDFQEIEKKGFLKYEGPTDPTINGSFGNLFTYKNFSLNLFITYSFGNVVRLDPVFKSKYTDMDAMPREFNNRWRMPGDKLKTNVPVIASVRQEKDIPNLKYAYNAYNYSDIRIASGGFIRMKEISLSYDFKKEWIQHLNLNSLQLKVQGTNLFLLYADKKLNGQDPEFFRSGGVSTPVPKQFTVTLRVSL